MGLSRRLGLVLMTSLPRREVSIVWLGGFWLGTSCLDVALLIYFVSLPFQPISESARLLNRLNYDGSCAVVDLDLIIDTTSKQCHSKRMGRAENPVAWIVLGWA